MAFTLEYIMLGFDFFIVACSLTLGIASYCFAIAIIEELQRMLHSISGKAPTNGKQSNKLKELFTQFIDAHGLMTQLSTHFSFEIREK